MALSIGQDIEVRVHPNDNPGEVVTDDQGAILYAVGQGIRVFLPAIEYPEKAEERRTFLRELRIPQTVRVRVTDYDEQTGIWEVSRKALAGGNPWQDEVPQWAPGETIKRMRVTSVHGSQVYGEISPGVVGKTSVRDILEYLGKQQDETTAAILIGDYVKGYVGEPDYAARIVPLDVADYLQYLDQQKSPPSQSPQLTDDLMSEPEERYNGPSLPIKTVLVVDDDDRFLRAIERRLQAEGLTVLTSRSLREARNTLWLAGDYHEPPDIDVAIIDVNLNPKGDQIDGLRLAHELREDRAWIKILLMSGAPDVRRLLAM